MKFGVYCAMAKLRVGIWSNPYESKLAAAGQRGWRRGYGSSSVKSFSQIDQEH